MTATLILALTNAVHSAEPPAEVQHSVFVVSHGTSVVTVIDNRTDQIVGKLDLGLIPTQIEVSSALPRLVATDGEATAFALVDLAGRQTRLIPTAFPARRLLLSEDGLKLGVSDLSGGHLAIFDLSDGHSVASFSGLPPLSDVIFTNGGTALLIAARGLAGVGMIDAATGKRIADIPMAHPIAGGVTGFTRSPNGRQAFAHGKDDGPIEVIDLEAIRSLTEIDAGRGPLVATPSGTGAYILVANRAKATVSIVHGEDFKLGAVLPSLTGETIAYSGWFDSVAFLSSRSESRLLVYDLWRLAKGGEIVLPGKPGPGTVTADGAKLYLPLPSSAQVAVIDIRYRRLASLIAIDAPPTAVAVAGGFGICH
jgi:DNA-binding beta-propeller fold protein YncE